MKDENEGTFPTAMLPFDKLRIKWLSMTKQEKQEWEQSGL
jgi:hypothetical protein